MSATGQFLLSLDKGNNAQMASKVTCWKHFVIRVTKVTGVFDGYAPTPATYDEMFDGPFVRPAYTSIYTQMQHLREEEIASRSDFLARSYVDEGVTFDIGGVERPFPIDLVPRLISAKDE